MFCTGCGEKSVEGQKFCTGCGTAFFNDTEIKEPISRTGSHPSPSSWGARRIVTALVIIGIIGLSIYGSLDGDAVTKNNEALTSFDSGDSQTAIDKLEQASHDAVTGDAKLSTLINLGYVYSSEGQYEKALQSFKAALSHASKNSFDHYLVLAEIALLEAKPAVAIVNYNKAYELRPNDFQINNAFNLFYLDLEEVAPYYTNYPKALQHAQKAYNNSDDLVKNTARQNLAIAHFFNENYDQVISLLRSTDISKEPYVAYWLGWSYVGKEDPANAKFYFQKAVDAGIELEQEVYDYMYTY